MLASFLITFGEALKAVLVIEIIGADISKIKRKDLLAKHRCEGRL